ncbi:hypothetical protein OGAPHI_003529 [Ogataea philodendri]|uniref:WD repeat-containing protein 48 n=1 Tax=Ogataea philodendri TaxID=1378263 RepID=A0A9P8P741_9ASCO|nr:uncharacterized protein OGAPHI_003529 [Ogataea philodendri]KAH3666532.1 hypothetical protein OGAPHI_003529 [Ogataea philodendri]
MTGAKHWARNSISYVLDPSNQEMSNHGIHSLGVNSLEYDKSNELLISGGRDGMVTIYLPTRRENEGLVFDEFDSKRQSSYEVKRFIKDNLSNEERILALEQSIRKGMHHERRQNSQFRATKFSQLHLDWITDLKIIDDKPLVASCSHDLSVKVWNYSTNTTSTIGFHDDYVKCLAYDGNSLASGGLDNTINIWDLTKEKQESFFKSKTENGSIYSIASLGNMIISGGPSQIVQLFDKRTISKPIRSFVGHTDTIRCLSLKKSAFLSGSSDSTIKLWDLRTNRILRNFDMHESSVWSLYVPEDQNEFETFFSGDKTGNLMKTDLRSSDFSFDILKEDYLDSRVNRNLGITTLISNINTNNKEGIGESELNQTSGVLSITGSHDSIWTSSSNPDLEFITSWPIPKTDKFLMYQGIKLNRNLSLLNTSSRKSFDSSPGDNFDIASQLSSENLDHIDDVLMSQMRMRKPTFDIGSPIAREGSGRVNFVLENSDSESELEESRYSYFVNVNGGPSSEFILSERGVESKTENGDPEDTLEIVFQRLPESLLYATPFVREPFEAITGAHGLIRSRLLNNRRHVAVMDDDGQVFLFDIVVGRLIKTIDHTEYTSDIKNLELNDRFDQIVQSLQSQESLPMWCTVQAKAGKLLITMEESKFANCQIYLDEFESSYDDYTIDCHEKLDPESSKVNIGETVLKSLMVEFTELEKKSLKSKTFTELATQPVTKSTSSNSTSVLSKMINKENLVSLASVNESLGEKSQSENEKDKPIRKMFGRHRPSITSTPSSKGVTDTGKNLDDHSKASTEEQIIESITEYREMQNAIVSGQLKVKKSVDHNPLIGMDKNIMIVINEEGQNATRAQLSTKLTEIEKRFDDLEGTVPLWAYKYLLFGSALIKELPKIVFVLVPHSSINDPLMKDFNSSRLNANPQLRIARVADFVKERLPDLLQDKKLQLICKDQVLDPKMTLLTIKSRIWKTSGDLELVFKFLS